MPEIDVEIKQLTAEIEKERRVKEALDRSTAELEDNLDRLQKIEKKEVTKSGSIGNDDEWKVRYYTQVELNEHLERQSKHLQDKLDRVTGQSQNGQKGLSAFLADLDFDTLSEPELARLVKQLEKDRNALYNELRDTEWKLDKESKAFHSYNEVRNAYLTEIHEALMNLEMLQKKQKITDDAVSVAKCPRHLKYVNISQDQRVIDPKKGPIKKAAAVRSLPKLDSPETSIGQKKKSASK
ncbi:CCDC169 (predicted) [Pycnogonum litorale]